MTTIRVTDQTTRAQLEVTIGLLCDAAKRLPHVVAKRTTDEPTAWDLSHGRIDAVLDTWSTTPA